MQNELEKFSIKLSILFAFDPFFTCNISIYFMDSTRNTFHVPNAIPLVRSIIYAISQSLSDLGDRMIFFLTITPNIVLFFANPWDRPLNSASESIVYHSAFFSSSFMRIVRRKETSSSRGKRDT